MSNQQLSHYRSLGQTIRLVGSSEAFTKRVILWTLPLGLFVAAGYDANRFETSRIGWLVVGLVAHGLATLIMLGLRLLLLPKSPYEPRPFPTILIFALGSMSRSIVVAELSYSMGLANETELGYRIFAGVLLGTLTISAVALIAAVTKEHADTQSELDAEREALVVAQETAQQLVEEQRAQVAGIVAESIEPSLQEISKNLTDSSIQDSAKLKTAAEAISNFIDNKLRPLSSSLHRKQEIAIPRIEAVGARPSLISLPKKISLQDVVSPAAIYVVQVIPNVTGAFPYAGYKSLPYVMVMYLPMLLIQNVFLRLPLAKRSLDSRFAIAIATLLFALSWTPAILIARAFGLDVIDQFGFIPVLTLGNIMVGFLLTYGFMVDNQRMIYEAELRQANQDLDRELNRTAQQIWHVRQHAAQVLHGSVQASLTAANMRILGATEVTEELLDRVRDDLVRATDSLTTLEDVNVDLHESFDELIELWRGMCQISIDIPTELMNQISGNQVTAHCVNEIVKECVNNAIRHGHSNRVDVTIEDLNDGSLRVSVTNDGDVNILGVQGVGSQILDEISMNWTRELVESRVIVTAQVAKAESK
jgi:signal transduction histidine kinase